MTVLRRVIST